MAEKIWIVIENDSKTGESEKDVSFQSANGLENLLKIKDTKNIPLLIVIDEKTENLNDNLKKLREWRDKLPWGGPKVSPVIDLVMDEDTSDEKEDYLIDEIIDSHMPDSHLWIWEKLDIEFLLQKAELARRQAEDKTMLGNSPAFKKLCGEIREHGPQETNVLITGETGVGKESVATSLHSFSERSKNELLTINSSAIASTLFESELFGHKKGAFSGADKDKAGLLAAAEEGTLFLDEVGEMDIINQPKILRAVEYKEYSPVGSDKIKKCNVRFISATNRTLEIETKKGKFREDLYRRIGQSCIEVPSLKDRREDIPLLANYFLTNLQLKGNKIVKCIEEKVYDCMEKYSWTGNVRELQNAIEQAYSNCKGRRIRFKDMPKNMREGNKMTPWQNSCFPALPPKDDDKKMMLNPYGEKKLETDKHLEVIKTVLFNKEGSFSAASNILKKAGFEKSADRSRLYNIFRQKDSDEYKWYEETFEKEPTR